MFFNCRVEEKIAFEKNNSSAELSVYILYAPFPKSVIVISLMSVNELHLTQSPRSVDLWMKKWLRQREARSVPSPWNREGLGGLNTMYCPSFLDSLYLHTQLGKQTPWPLKKYTMKISLVFSPCLKREATFLCDKLCWVITFATKNVCSHLLFHVFIKINQA